MSDPVQRRVLIDEYHALIGFLFDRGAQVTVLSDEELAKMSDSELGRVVKQYRDLCRTPSA